jgi:predicted dinucleotide-binding enzyme
MIDGPASVQASSDQVAVTLDEAGFNQIEMQQLPDSWAQAIQDQVLFVAGGSSPEQVQTAASAAMSLAEQIGLLCYTPSAVNPLAPGVLTYPVS